MTAFVAKDAGTLAEQNMATMNIDWVTFEGKRIEYRPAKPGAHYDLIVAATREKVLQNPEVRKVLLATGDHSEARSSSRAERAGCVEVLRDPHEDSRSVAALKARRSQSNENRLLSIQVGR